MGETRYPHRLDKVAIAMLSSMNAKEHGVKKYGIGEELPLNLMCWRDDRLELVMCAKEEVRSSGSDERFRIIQEALCIARRGWGITAFTLIAEAYCSLDPSITDGLDLRKEFCKHDSPVMECLTIAHVEPGEVTFITKPYRYECGRKVEWEEELYYPGHTRVQGQEAMFPNLLSKVLVDVQQDTPPVDEITYYAELGDGLLAKGFVCDWL